MKETLALLVADFIDKLEYNFKFNGYSIYYKNEEDKYIIKIYSEGELVGDVFVLKLNDNDVNSITRAIYNIVK